MERWCSVEELGELVGKSDRRIRQIDSELPDKEKLLKKGEGGKYDLFFFVKKWTEYSIKLKVGGKQLNLEDVKAQHELLKMEQTQIELGKTKGDICSTEEVYRLWADLARTVTGKLMSIPSMLAPRITGLENTEVVEAAIEREIRDSLTAISRTPMPKGLIKDEPAKPLGKHTGNVPAAGADEGE